MDYHQVSIATPNTRALGKLKRGHKVRLIHGDGMTLIVDPVKYSQITRSFSHGSGVHVSLSPDEIRHNHAEGVFSTLKNTAKKVGHAIKPIVKPLAKIGIKKGLDYAGKAIAESNPELAPLVPLGVEGLSNAANSIIGGSFNAPPSRHVATSAINAYNGEDSGKLDKANIGTFLANRAQAHLAGVKAMKALTGHGLFAEPGGGGLYAQPAGGRGLYAEPMSARGLPGRRKEMSSVGIHGNLLQGTGLPPALTPQPFSANFQFGHTLPPAYQAFANSGQ